MTSIPSGWIRPIVVVSLFLYMLYTLPICYGHCGVTTRSCGLPPYYVDYAMDVFHFHFIMLACIGLCLGVCAQTYGSYLVLHGTQCLL